MSEEFLTYKILCILRIVLTLVPQSGYIHPDEHFQGPEIAYGDIAQYKVLHTWEFSSSKPIRSIIFPYSISIIPAIIIRLFTLLDFKISSYLLLVLPRLVICLCSFLQDICIYQICIFMKADCKPCLNLFASSYVTLIYFTRTFSNSLESVLFALILFFSFKSLNFFQKINYENDELPYDENNNNFQSKLSFYGFLSSVIFVLGCFIRPTFICFAIFPMTVWGFILYKVHIHVKINIFLSLILGAISMCLCLVAIDTFYYNKIHYSTLKSFKLICTPINFIFYNLNPINLSSHGLHPRWLHVIVNIPLLFSNYGIILLLFCIVKIRYFFRQISDNIEMLLFLCFVGPLILLSTVPHQEPRFIIPLIIPLCLLYNLYIRNCLSNKFYIYIWITHNVFCLLFYGFIHQAGVYLSISHLSNVIENKSVVIFYKSYMPPRYLFSLSKNSKTCGIYDFNGLEIDEFEMRMQDIISNNNPSKVFVILPYTILNSDMHFEALTISGYKFIEKITLFPHLSTENLPKYSSLFNIIQTKSTFIDKLNQIQEIFSIYIISFQKYYK